MAVPRENARFANFLFNEQKARRRSNTARALEWAKKTGNTLEYIDRPNDPSATLSEYVHHWAVKRDIDVYVIDARLRKS